jgi:prophage tail gpP-like protein
VKEGAACQVHFGKALLLTGYVNTADWGVDGNSWDLSARGRSRSGDLEDCSAVSASGHWQNKSPISIVRELIEPFGITVSSTVAEALLPMKRFALQEGEFVHDAIERLAEMTALLPISLPDGNMELIRSDIPRDRVVVFPVADAIHRKVSTDDQDRYSDYYAIGQSWGNKNRSGRAIVQMRHEVQDEAITRYRPLILIADHAVDQLEQLRARANWERNVRAGRSMRYKAVMIGVLAPNGKPWTPGWHCVVQDGPLGVDDTLVLVRANIRASSTELVTELEFTRPEAYSILTYPPRVRLNKKPRLPKEPELCFSPDQLAAAGADLSKLGL